MIQLDDGTQVLVDTAPDLRAQALAFGVRRVDAILFTHSHADHVLGLDEVRRFNALQGEPIPCYGDPETIAAVRRIFAYAFDRHAATGGGLPRIVTFSLAGPFSLGRQEFVPVPLMHGTRPILGYRVGAFAYLTDCSAIPDGSWSLVAEIDTLVIDALRDRPHPTHFTVEDAVQAAARIGARRTFFTHMAHDLPHEATCARLPAGMALAYDGLIVQV